MDSSLKIHRQLWPFGFRFEYNAAVDLTPVRLSLLANGLLQTIIPPQAFSRGLLTDLKGRDALNFIAEPVPEPPVQDELLYLEGRWPSSMEGQDAQDERAFAMRISSIFDSFPSPGHIQHRFEIESGGEPPPGIPAQLLGFAAPVRLKIIRIGIDLFSTFFISSLAGLTPSVTNTLLIEASEAKLQLRCVREGMKTRRDEPLPPQLLADVNRVLKSACDFDLLADIDQKRT